MTEPTVAKGPDVKDKADCDALIEYARKNGFDFFGRVPLDIRGMGNSFGHPIARMAPGEILGFDGSSLKGYQSIDASDMKTELVPESVFIDRTNGEQGLLVLARILDPETDKPYPRDPINIAMKAEAYLKKTGIADTAHFGPEAEFFILDHVESQVDRNGCHYRVDSEEGAWNSGRNGTPNTGYRPGHKEGYSHLPPIDSLRDLRREIMRELEFNGIPTETEHHEVATAGQGEIDLKYAPLLQMGHNLTWFKHVVKNVAAKHGKTATFLPKPIMDDNGSGMHVHQSLWKEGKPLFAGDKYAGLSELALHYIGGILKHAPALCALTNPSTNSYKRLVPHCEAPINRVYSARNRSAAIRIPRYAPTDPKATRIEVRFPDPLACGYLAFSAMLMAGLDGIENRIDPGSAFDGDAYSAEAELPTLPASLEQALNALKEDHAFLTKGDVFTQDFLDAWVALKREEVQYVRKITHPAEIELYFMG